MKVVSYVLYLCALLSALLFWVGDVQAHLVTQPAKSTVVAVIASQEKNLDHARYVCNNGSRAPKTWHCKAAWGWLHYQYELSVDRIITPMWDSIFDCETGGKRDWHINTGNGYYGGIQFDRHTWHEAQRNLGVFWTDLAHQAEPWQQVAAAKTLPLTRWPNCAARYR